MVSWSEVHKINNSYIPYFLIIVLSSSYAT